MTERNNSIVQAREKFMKAGGVFLGKEQWDRILVEIPQMYEDYEKVSPRIRSYGCNFAKEVISAGASKAGYIVENGKRMPYYFEVYVRQDGRYYITLDERKGRPIERISDNSEITGYLALKVLQGKMTFEEACLELVHGRV